MKAAGYADDGSDIRPGLIHTLNKLGIVAQSKNPESMADLWDDVKYAIEDFQHHLADTNYVTNEIFSRSDNGIPIITQFERASAWGVSP